MSKDETKEIEKTEGQTEDKNEGKTFTQSELDAIIQERLNRQSKTHSTELASITEERNNLKTEKEALQNQINELTEKINKANNEKSAIETTVSELRGQLKGYESDSAKRRIAAEAGLPENAVDFISGDDEEAMKASAAELRKIVGFNMAPLYTKSDGNEGSEKDQALKGMLEELKK